MSKANKQISWEAKALVRTILTPDQDDRPTALQLLQTSHWISANTSLFSYTNPY